MGKAPLGGGKTGPNPTDRGKRGVKRSVLTDGRGVPLGAAVDGANRNDHKLMRPTLEAIPVRRPRPTRRRPQHLCLGKGFDYDEPRDRKSTRLNSSHANISYAVFCLKTKKLTYALSKSTADK